MQSDFTAGVVIPGEATPTVSVWTQLVPKSPTSKCSRIRVNAPAALANSSSFLIIISSALDASGRPAAPTSAAGAFELPNTASGLNYLWYADASWVWLFSQHSGDKVEFSIES